MTSIMTMLHPAIDLFREVKNKTAFDVGANEGGYIETFFINGATKVYAFEPGTQLCEKIKRKFADRDVVIEQCAVSDNPGTLENVTWLNSWLLACPEDHPDMQIAKSNCDFAEEHERFSVSVITLDDYTKDKDIGDFNFLKIDVDGYDYKVMKGSQALITKYRPIIYIELSYYVNLVPESSVEKFIELVKELNYQFVTCDGRTYSYDVAWRAWPRESSCDAWLLPIEKIDLYKPYLREEVL